MECFEDIDTKNPTLKALDLILAAWDEGVDTGVNGREISHDNGNPASLCLDDWDAKTFTHGIAQIHVGTVIHHCHVFGGQAFEMVMSDSRGNGKEVCSTQPSAVVRSTWLGA